MSPELRAAGLLLHPDNQAIKTIAAAIREAENEARISGIEEAANFVEGTVFSQCTSGFIATQIRRLKTL